MDADKHWDLYTLCEITQWSVLPRAGGWEDQDDGFLHDVGIFSRRISYLRKIREINKERKQSAKSKLKAAWKG